MSNKGEFLSKVANLASRFDNEDEILDEAEEYYEDNTNQA